MRTTGDDEEMSRDARTMNATDLVSISDEIPHVDLMSILSESKKRERERGRVVDKRE